MHPILAAHLAWLAATNHAPATCRNIRSAVTRFLDWLGQAHPDAELPHLRPAHLEGYQVYLAELRRPRDGALAWGTQAEYLGALQSFFAWARARRLLRHDPAVRLTLPRRPVQLPAAVLTHLEMERVLRQPRTSTALGLRDRALLELLYSTGLRRAEAARLRLGEVDGARGVVMVRAGKGQRDRVVPIGRRALRWVSRYLRASRPKLVQGPDPEWLFLSRRGTSLRLNRLSERVTRYVRGAGIGKHGSCHLFRHTMATVLLEGGADVREVQEMLGHTNLATTARYTHVAIGRLQAVHARAHPAERGERLAPLGRWRYF